MNNRFKELASQAGGEFYEGFAGSPNTVKFTEYELGKFAELIVQECAIVIQKEVSMKYKDGGENEEFMGGHYAGSVLARVMIKKHFGIEQ